MRDLYRALGFSGITADQGAIERALRLVATAPDIREAARFVLLDPVRKGRYDWVLSRALELSLARSSLGLLKDPSLPDRSAAPQPTLRDPVPRGRARWHTRAFWSVAAILFGVALVWVGHRSNREPKASFSEAALAFPGFPGEKKRPPADNFAVAAPENLTPISPPDHGWLQLGSEVHPLAPWHIDTDPGQDYALTLLDVKTQAVVLTLFLRGGEPYQGLVPEGTFELAYTTGTQWFGHQQGFGAKAKAVKPAMVYRVEAGPEGKGAWKLRLNPNSCEGMPTNTGPTPGSAPGPGPGASDDDPAARSPDRSL